MATISSPNPADPRKDQTVRVEVAFEGERHIHEVNTNLFLKSVEVTRRGDRVYWKMDIVRVIMPDETARDAIQHSLHMLPDDDKWSVIEPIVRELLANGYRFDT